MTELKFDHPVEDLIAEEDAQTLLAIDQGIAQLDAGQGIPLSELRAELAKRCAKTDS
jgi:fructose-bisphosphate aldolase class 1